MMRPMRCFSCGKPLADKYDEFEKRVEEGEEPEEIFEDMEIERYCCRRMILTSIDATEEMMKYER
ncbi:DNA-directed RNA polymerase subunit N [candidate division MSBL1 archaeon SCGC-AAA259I09]|uniref:DNA-directed RNA polymerase subunit Rpo10 n=2 Tax=candidate division MSBL1 TaxID=215777 RepID=A0A133UTG5_9EURY|nr:DNA-directed RNA polymerase subunit N [candidate division MSBL1 archaeon SCGC-AAA259I09]KXA98797.1 DNA-directed RNA polymerase subunit N [candidate division MSBL1 archaeon SCGC-AAA259J03]